MLFYHYTIPCFDIHTILVCSNRCLETKVYHSIFHLEVHPENSLILVKVCVAKSLLQLWCPIFIVTMRIFTLPSKVSPWILDQEHTNTLSFNDFKYSISVVTNQAYIVFIRDSTCPNCDQAIIIAITYKDLLPKLFLQGEILFCLLEVILLR